MTDQRPRTRPGERELARVAATRRGIHDRLAQLDAGRAPDFSPHRTLKLRVEFARQLRRRRTQVAFGLLLFAGGRNSRADSRVDSDTDPEVDPSTRYHWCCRILGSVHREAMSHNSYGFQPVAICFVKYRR